MFSASAHESSTWTYKSSFHLVLSFYLNNQYRDQYAIRVRCHSYTYFWASRRAGKQFPELFKISSSTHTHSSGHSGRLGIGWMVEQLWGLFYPLPFPSCTHARLVHFRHLLYLSFLHIRCPYVSGYSRYPSESAIRKHTLLFTMKKKRKPSTKSRSPPES